jgi:hypothetical protein
MRLVSGVRLKTFERTDQLQFRMVRKYGLIDNIAGPLVTVILLFPGFRQPSRILLIFGGIALISLIANWLRGRETELCVTNTELVAAGNLETIFYSRISVLASEITSLEWRCGDEGSSEGMWLRHGSGYACVLPGLSEEQATEVIETISRRFPEMGVDHSPTSIIFGEQSGVTTLGLSSPELPVSDMRNQLDRR